VEELRAEAERCEGRCEELRKEVGAEKGANDEMLSVLMRLDRQEKELWSSYNALAGKFQEAQEKNRFMEGEFQLMKDSLTAAQNDNDFMKRLIFHANENYELLERKYVDLEALRERTEANTDRKNLAKLSTEHLLKSAKTRKKGYSPSHSEAVQHSPSVDNFEEVYQKMILRTLKFKGKQNHIR
jgi:chromosome segregation ATPase